MSWHLRVGYVSVLQEVMSRHALQLHLRHHSAGAQAHPGHIEHLRVRIIPAAIKLHNL